VSLLSKTKGKSPEARGPGQGMSARELAVFQRILHEKSGIVLADNKRALVESRVNQRLRALEMPGYGQYLEFLAGDRTGEELVHLIDAVSTNITRFFREGDHFQLLEKVVGEWAESGLRRMRFWSAACSTGEEPYSMAMTLHPLIARYGLDLKILATDISTRVLAQAQAGCYSREVLEKVPDDLQSRYFGPCRGSGEDVFQVSDQLKRMIMFRRLNFTVFPYPIKGIFDVIFCRNAMIYFDKELRQRMVREFARLLKPDGILMIGHAETLIGMEKEYRTVKPSVYLRHNDGVDV